MAIRESEILDYRWDVDHMSSVLNQEQFSLAVIPICMVWGHEKIDTA